MGQVSACLPFGAILRGSFRVVRKYVSSKVEPDYNRIPSTVNK